MENVEIAILGAGIAGLGAALKSRELGLQAVIFEARDSAGGLLDNFVIDGYRFDHAVHLSFATEAKVREIFDRTPFNIHPTTSRCFDNGLWMKHPVQNNLFPLEPSEKVRLIESFVGRPQLQNPQNYELWLRAQYGDAIAEKYPLRYTEKYWATPAHELSISWIGDRMRRASLEEVLYGAVSDETPNTYYAKEMRYPKQGGYKSFIQPLIDASKIRLQHSAIAINSKRKIVEFNGRPAITYDRLLSSLPLPKLISILDDVPSEVDEAATCLVATSIDLISVGFRAKCVADLWFYIYDNDIAASRAYSPSVKSEANAPAGCSSIQFEAYSRGRQSRFTPAYLKENTLFALKKMGIGEESDIAFVDHRRLEYGNVIFDLGMEERREKVKSFLKQRGISSCGRFGEWDYLWSNQSLLSGYNAVSEA